MLQSCWSLPPCTTQSSSNCPAFSSSLSTWLLYWSQSENETFVLLIFHWQEGPSDEGCLCRVQFRKWKQIQILQKSFTFSHFSCFPLWTISILINKQSSNRLKSSFGLSESEHVWKQEKSAVRCRAAENRVFVYSTHRTSMQLLKMYFFFLFYSSSLVFDS